MWPRRRNAARYVPSFEDKHYANHSHNIHSLPVLVEMLDQRYSNISIVALLGYTVLELLSLGIYIWTSQTTVAGSIWHFQWSPGAFLTAIVINGIFFGVWVGLFFMEVDKRSFLISRLSVVTVLTSVPMMMVGFAGIKDDKWRSVWVPLYLRVWWLHDCLKVLLDYEQVARLMIDIHREVVRFFIRLFAIISTCVGTLQMVESISGNELDLFNTLYMMIVALGTIGYGDVTPLSNISRLLMCFFISIGICYFLPLFQHMAKIAERRHYYNTYSKHWQKGSSAHVIICGQFRDSSVDIILRNFYAGWRVYLDTRIVLMSSEPHSEEVKLLANLPWFKDRVDLMIGDPVHVSDLRRAMAHEADAIFLFGNTRSTAYYNDYHLIAQSMSVTLYDPFLPQHVLLRREQTVKQIAPYAASILQMEGTVHRLLGLAMVQPGVIPLLMNLLRTYEPLPLDLTLSRNWVEQYEYSLRNDLYAVAVPDALRGRDFRILARAFYEQEVTLLGVVSAREVVHLNPRRLRPNAKKLVLIARTMRVATAATMDIAHKYKQTFGEEMLTAPAPEDYMKKASNTSGRRPLYCCGTKSPADVLQASDQDDDDDDEDVQAVRNKRVTPGEDEPPAAATSAFVYIDDALDFENHFVVVDLAAAKANESETRYSQQSNLVATAHDVYHVLHPIRQYFPHNDIVLLTLDVAFMHYFEQYWKDPTSANPVKCIRGCGLNMADLWRCNIQNCAGCCIFYSGDINRFGSTSGMSMLAVLTIQDIMQGTPAFPVVVELEGLTNLPLFPPNADDLRLRSKADVDYVFEPNYIIGNALSRLMLFPALQRAYFMAEFIDILNALIRGGGDEPSLGRMPLALCEEELDVYEDVVKYCLSLGLLPIALHRRIHDPLNPSIHGQRFMLTNPPHTLAVFRDSDIVVYVRPE